LLSGAGVRLSGNLFGFSAMLEIGSPGLLHPIGALRPTVTEPGVGLPAAAAARNIKKIALALTF